MFGKGFLYAVYENGEKIFEGTANEVGEHFKMSPKSVNTYSKRNSKFENKYDIKVTGRTQSIQKPYVKKQKPDKKSEEAAYLEYLEQKIRLFGNVWVHGDPQKYILKLKEKGIECVVREYLVTDYNSSPSVKRRKTVKDHVLERVNAERRSESI